MNIILIDAVCASEALKYSMTRRKYAVHPDYISTRSAKNRKQKGLEMSHPYYPMVTTSASSSERKWSYPKESSMIAEIFEESKNIFLHALSFNSNELDDPFQGGITRLDCGNP
jgi:hypothetical protein